MFMMAFLVSIQAATPTPRQAPVTVRDPIAGMTCGPWVDTKTGGSVRYCETVQAMKRSKQ